MKVRTLLLAALTWLFSTSFTPQTHAAEDPVHAELRTLRLAVLDLVTKGDMQGVLRHVHPNAVITWQNNEVCRGHQGLMDFFNRMGKDAFKSYEVPPTPDELTILHGENTGISHGKVVAKYSLLGKDITMTSRWTATLVKEGSRWQLASYHVSANLLDNPLLNGAKTALYIAGGLALVVGLIIGAFIARRKRA
jgi:ketosteroid isomerase-like protein